MDAVATLPELVVEVESRALSRELQQALGEIVISQQLSQPSQCELTFFDLPVNASIDELVPGRSVVVRGPGLEATLFDGQVTAVNDRYGPDQGRELRIRCYDRLHRLRKRQPVRAHDEQTLAELAEALVAELGLRVEAADAGPATRWRVQHDRSDLALLQNATERCGYYFFLHAGALQLFTLAGRDDEPVELAWGDALAEVVVDVNSDRSCRVVEALAWDPWRAALCSGAADAVRSGRETMAEAAPGSVGGDDRRTLAGLSAQDASGAEALAQGELDRRHANEVALSGVALGHAGLRPGIPVRIAGLAESVNGRYVLTRAVHRVDRRRGYLTEIDTSVTLPEQSAAPAGMTFGIVTDIEDPQALGRVRVTLPGYADADSLWLQVLHPGAGADKGLVAMPDVDDRVLILFADNDPTQGVVLGGLYGETEPPDSAGIDGGRVERFLFVTPGGQRLTLDDDRRRVRVENNGGEFLELAPDRVRAGNSDGSFIELASSRVRLHAEADLEIEAPGKAVTIRGKSIDFESA